MSSRHRDDDYSPPPRRGGGERWDRERMDAYERRAPVAERDRYEEEDYYYRSQRREPSPRRAETRERVILEERDRYETPQRPRYRWEEEEDRISGAMVHRPREEERDIDIEIRRREYERSPREFERPKFVRRQSSLDTYDRKPMPRYGDIARVREETIMVPVAGRRDSPRYRSPPRFDEVEEARYADQERFMEEDFRGYREREYSRVRRNDDTDYEFEEREEIIEETRNFPKRGKTKMPSRLVNIDVLVELDYPFEQEGETVIVLKALHKDHIDEIIKLSRDRNARARETKKTTRYVIGGEEKVVEKRTEIIKEIMPGAEPSPTVPRSVSEWDHLSRKASHISLVSSSPSPPPLLRSRRRSRAKSVSEVREIVISNDREESASIRQGIGALIVPNRERRKSRDIQAEIRLLEDEKRVLKLERRRDPDEHEMVIVTEKDDEIVKVKRSRPSPNPKLLRGMLWTLT